MTMGRNKDPRFKGSPKFKVTQRVYAVTNKSCTGIYHSAKEAHEAMRGITPKDKKYMIFYDEREAEAWVEQALGDKHLDAAWRLEAAHIHWQTAQEQADEQMTPQFSFNTAPSPPSKTESVPENGKDRFDAVLARLRGTIPVPYGQMASEALTAPSLVPRSSSSDERSLAPLQSRRHPSDRSASESRDGEHSDARDFSDDAPDESAGDIEQESHSFYNQPPMWFFDTTGHWPTRGPTEIAADSPQAVFEPTTNHCAVDDQAAREVGTPVPTGETMSFSPPEPGSRKIKKQRVKSVKNRDEAYRTICRQLNIEPGKNISACRLLVGKKIGEIFKNGGGVHSREWEIILAFSRSLQGKALDRYKHNTESVVWELFVNSMKHKTWQTIHKNEVDWILSGKVTERLTRNGGEFR